MKIKALDFRNAYTSLQKLLGMELPFKLVYRINKITKKLISEMDELEAVRIELVKKYGTLDDKKMYVIPDDKMSLFSEEYNGVLEQELDIDIQCIPYELLEEANVKLSLFDMKRIECLVSKPDSDKKEEIK